MTAPLVFAGVCLLVAYSGLIVLLIRELDRDD